MLAVTLAVCLMGASYAAGFATSALLTPRPTPQAPAVAEEPTYQGPREFRVFWEVQDILQREYYASLPSDQEMVYNAIRGVVDSLGDPHTAFADPEHARLFSEDLSGSFQGIGTHVEMRDDQLVIVSLLPGAPAEQAGLRPGDVILAVDGEPLAGMSLFEAVTRIRGPQGTRVTLTIQRPNEPPFDVVLTRARIEVPTVEARELAEGRIGYLRIFEFNERAPREVEVALRKLLASPSVRRTGKPQALILDLRDDPGGYLHVAVDVASQFLGDGLVLMEQRKDGTVEEHRARTGGLATDPDLPLVVLVNQGTASAAEIVAGAIQDQNRGVLIGERTFGKGSVQVTHTLSDQSSLRVTIARWFTPSGREIHGQGLAPDLEVPRETDAESGRDTQLQAAIEYLLDRLQ